MKLIYPNYILVLLLGVSYFSTAQVGINTTNPQAQLDIAASNVVTPSNTDGLLVPRIDAFPATNPTATQQGMLVYLTTTVGANTPGFYYWDNNTTNWVAISQSALETDPQVSSAGADYIPKWNGTTLVDGQIFDNNLNVGIGTTTPSEKLEVIGNIKGANIYADTFLSTGATLSNSLGAVATFNTNANAPVLFGETTNNKGVMIGYDGSDIQGRSGSNLSQNSDLTINRYGGNVGVGVASPTEKLEVNGKTKTTNLQITTGANSGFLLQSDATGNGTWVNPASLTTTETDPQVTSSTTNYIPKWNGTTLVDGQIFDTGTNIGVGTATPSDKIHVVGNIKVDVGRIPFVNTGRSVFIGEDAGLNDDLTNNDNTVIGYNALKTNIVGAGNTAIGYRTLENSTANSNTGIGYSNLVSNTSGIWNVSLGRSVLSSNTIGSHNIAMGGQSLFSNVSGNNNVALGSNVLALHTTGDNNVAIGFQAGYNNLSGTGNIFIGHTAGLNETGSNKLYIANTNTASPLIYGDFSANFLRFNGTVNINNAYNLPLISGLANQVLQTTGFGATNWVNASSLAITENDPQVSSSATNSVPKWNGTTLIDGQVFDNGTNVGIGTTAPGQKLDVNGNIRGTNIYATNYLQTGTILPNTLNPIATFNTGGALPVLIGDSSINKGILLGKNGNDIQGRTNPNFTGNSDLLLNSLGGNVGVGTNTPATHFHIASDNAVTNTTIESGNQQYPTALSILPSTHATSRRSLIKLDDWSLLQDFSGTGTKDFSIYQGTTFAQRLTIGTTGNIGIGTTSPTSKLEVAGKTTTTNFQMTNGAVGTYLLQSDGLGNATWVNPNSITVSEIDPQVSSSTINRVAKWNGSTLVDGIIQDNGTSLGINTAPIAGNDLTVNGKTATANFQMTNGATNGYLLQSSATGNASWVNPTSITFSESDPQVSSVSTNAIPKWNGTSLVDGQVYDSGINVGIGTNTPTSKLDIVGKTTTTNLQITNGAVGDYVLKSDALGNASWVNPNTLTITESDPQVSSTTISRVPKWSGTDLIDGIIQDNGLGIGINTAPVSGNEFSVNGKTSTTNLQVTTGATSGFVLQSDALGNGTWVNPTSLSITETDPQVSSTTTNYIPKWNGTTLVDGQVFDNGTNVGIGNNSPNALLTIGSNISPLLPFIPKLSVNTTGNSPVFVGETTNQKGIIIGYDGNNIQGRSGANFSANSDLILNNYGGNVGINTTTPTEKLDVNGKTKTTNLQITNGATNGYVLQSDASGNGTWVNPTSLSITETDPQVSSTTTNYIPKWNGTSLIDGQVFDDGTNVGIGTTSPIEKLDVIGNIRATNVYATSFLRAGGILPNTLNPIATFHTGSSKPVLIGDSGVNKGVLIGASGNDIQGRSLANFVLPDVLSLNPSGGNVGIGTSTPTTKLDVNGKTKTTTFQITNGATNGYVLQSDATGNGTWVNPTTLSITETDPQVSSTTTNYMPKWNGTSLVDGQVFDDGTNVGIGTTTPTQAKLVVQGFDSNTFANYGFLNRTGPTGIVNPAAVQNYSIYASNRIAASEFNAFSDARIKNIKGVSNTKEDLKTLMNIEITDYRLKDSIAKGNKDYKKVIAQQVEKVYPQAVSKITDVIPDIYKQAEINNGFVVLENTLKVGEKVKIIFQSGEELVEIKEANAKGFKIDSNKNEKVFVYGRQVTDFHTVDYEALSTLNISATQELLKRIETLEKENDALKAEVENLSSLKKDVESLKSFLFNTSQTKKVETADTTH